MKKKGFFGYRQYVIAGLLIALAAVGTTALYSSRQEEEREQMEEELAREMQKQSDDIAAQEDSEQSAEASALVPPRQSYDEMENELDDPAVTAEIAEEDDTAETEESEETEQQTVQTANTAQSLHFSEELLWPMEGNVVINYSMDSTVYFPTLDQYKYNPAVIIEGAEGDQVLCGAPGIIKSIDVSAQTGTTVNVDIGNGYELLYGQLKEVPVKVGDYVEAKSVLGYVSQPTKYYSKEGCNVYFEMRKNGQPVNPVEYTADQD